MLGCCVVCCAIFVCKHFILLQLKTIQNLNKSCAKLLNEVYSVQQLKNFSGSLETYTIPFSECDLLEQIDVSSIFMLWARRTHYAMKIGSSVCSLCISNVEPSRICMVNSILIENMKPHSIICIYILCPSLSLSPFTFCLPPHSISFSFE